MFKESTIHEAFGITSEKGDTKAIKVADLVEIGEHIPLPEMVDLGYVFTYQAVRRFLGAVRLGKSLWLWGPAGSGKTELAVQIGLRLHRPVPVISFSEESSLRDLLGTWKLANQETSWSPGALAQAVTQPGSIVVLDEVNMAPSGVLAALNSLLQRREIVINETGETITVAPGVIFVATANTAGGADETGLYAGSQIMNGATRSRFSGLKLDYLDAESEAEIIRRKFPDLLKMFDEDPAPKMVETGRMIRSIADEGRVSLPFSVRQLLAWAEGVIEFGDISEGFLFAYGDLLSPSELPAVAEAFFKVFGISLG